MLNILTYIHNLRSTLFFMCASVPLLWLSSPKCMDFHIPYCIPAAFSEDVSLFFLFGLLFTACPNCSSHQLFDPFVLLHSFTIVFSFYYYLFVLCVCPISQTLSGCGMNTLPRHYFGCTIYNSLGNWKTTPIFETTPNQRKKTCYDNNSLHFGVRFFFRFLLKRKSQRQRAAKMEKCSQWFDWISTKFNLIYMVYTQYTLRAAKSFQYPWLFPSTESNYMISHKMLSLSSLLTNLTHLHLFTHSLQLLPYSLSFRSRNMIFIVYTELTDTVSAPNTTTITEWRSEMM